MNALKSLYIGTISGLVLGVFMYSVELFVGHKVYTLLLNVDFVSFLGNPSKVLEWLFHLIISWGISMVFVVIVDKYRMKVKKKIVVALILSGTAMISYFPLTILAKKQTPMITDVEAFLFWVVGHVLYAITCVYIEDNWMNRVQ